MLRWKTICFDLDNTLFSHEEAFEKAMLYCFGQIYSNLDKVASKVIESKTWFIKFKKNCDRYWPLLEKKRIDRLTYQRLRYKATMEELQLPYNAEDADKLHQLYYEVVSECSVPYPNVKELFYLLNDKQVKVGIITNGNKKTQYKKIKQLGLLPFFRKGAIFVSEKIGSSKPNAHIFHYAKTQLGSINETCLYIGDSWELDIIGAIDAGWDAIYLNTRNQSPSTSHQPIAICRDLVDVIDVLKKENGWGGTVHEYHPS